MRAIGSAARQFRLIVAKNRVVGAIETGSINSHRLVIAPTGWLYTRRGACRAGSRPVSVARRSPFFESLQPLLSQTGGEG
jgi:hypothetical protein